MLYPQVSRSHVHAPHWRARHAPASRPLLRHNSRHTAVQNSRHNTASADVVVVGTGIVGLCIAHKLLQQGVSVILTDRQQPCAGATGAGQGYIWMCHRDPASPLWNMAAAGKARWEELDAQGGALGEAMEWQGNGSLLLATTPDEVSSLEARMGTLQAAGVTDAHMLTSQQLAELEPALRLPQGSAGLHVPSDGQLNGRRAAEAMLVECQRLGAEARLHQATVSIQPGEGGAGGTVTTTESRLHAAQAVVVAAGVWSGELLAAATADNSWLATFAPRRGHLLVVDRPTGMPVLKTGMMEVAYTKYYGGQSGMPGTDSDAFDIIFTATTSKNGQLLVGSSREFAGWETVKQERVVDAIMERAVQFLPELKTTPADTRVGLRPYAVAGAPTVGWVPGLPGIMVAAGHEGSGLCLGPGTADVVVGLLERAR